MPPENKVKLAGVAYPLAWGNLALFRFRSIPAASRNVVGPAMLAQIVWAAYKGVVHPFPSWEHALAAIAELCPEDYAALDDCMAAHLPAPEESAENASESPEKPAAEPSDAEKKSDSTKPEPSPDAALG